MSHHRGWHQRRHDRQYQDDRYYRQTGTSYYGHGSSYAAQPYAHDPNGYYWADAQQSQGYNYNYWRDDAYCASHPYEPPVDYHHSHRYADDDHLAERSYRHRQRQRSDSPYRQYHTRAERPDPPTPYTTPPSFRWGTPDTVSCSPAPRTKSPTPPPPPPAEPDPAYLTLSSEPSHILDDPRTARKLLILDLNGTLLIRSQHNPRARNKVAHGGSNTSAAPRMRAVQPRPYIPSFRAYLFAPETREWLDTMVWSSAQPHSVADMVDKVFGDSQSKLVAVWNRDSLGLSRDEYFRKAQTTKDLTKPWTMISSGTSQAELVVQSEVNGVVEKTGLAPSIAHSAMTTLLLDDSPAKARLQPYNHVCIPEYDSSLRGTDLELYERERMKATSKVAATGNELPEEGSQAQGQKMRTPRAQKERALPVLGQTESADISSSSDSDLSVADSPPARAKQSSISILPTGEARISSRPAETYDPTLLAVIGILDEIKKQSSVAGWIRGGGLLDLVAATPGEITSGPDASVDDPAPPTDRQVKRLAKKERKRAGKSARTASKARFSPHKEEIQTGNDETGVGTQGVRMWFSDDNALSYWVGRGRSALERLGIEAIHGVTK